jgi:hypothetical protein
MGFPSILRHAPTGNETWSVMTSSIVVEIGTGTEMSEGGDQSGDTVLPTRIEILGTRTN